MRYDLDTWLGATLWLTSILVIAFVIAFSLTKSIKECEPRRNE